MKLPIIPQDKANHMIYGFAIYFTANLLFVPLLSLFIVAVFAWIKEIYDLNSGKGTPEVMDFVCTVIPAALLVISELLKTRL